MSVASSTLALRLAFPVHAPGTPQDAESVLVQDSEHGWREIRLHDYAAIYSLPGLYEQLFADVLACDSPRIVVDHLARNLEKHRVDPRSLRCLDLGAGNGMVGEQLAARGLTRLYGLDLLPEARSAAIRDRPHAYHDYLVGDITRPATAKAVAAFRPNLLVCVAACGFGDISVEAFASALGLLPVGSWVVFNLRSDFLADTRPGGFADRLTALGRDGTIRLLDEHRYVHRLAVDGSPIEYTSIVACTG